MRFQYIVKIKILQDFSDNSLSFNPCSTFRSSLFNHIKHDHSVETWYRSLVSFFTHIFAVRFYIISIIDTALHKINFCIGKPASEYTSLSENQSYLIRLIWKGTDKFNYPCLCPCLYNISYLLHHTDAILCVSALLRSFLSAIKSCSYYSCRREGH